MIKGLFIFSTLFMAFSPGASIADQSLEISSDPHYNQIGFFDIHICNWPERPYYFKIIFSSEYFDRIKTMDVHMPDNQLLVSLDKSKYRTLKRRNKPDKRVYILDIDVPDSATAGWYKINITTDDGATFQAQDYVIMSRLEKTTEMYPSSDNDEFDLPVTLKWKPVPGSKYYQTFVRDAWTEILVFKSKLIDTPEITIPDDRLEPGGHYYWTVHSRDTNEHVLLGDFHMGSMSNKTYFTVAE